MAIHQATYYHMTATYNYMQLLIIMTATYYHMAATY